LVCCLKKKIYTSRWLEVGIYKERKRIYFLAHAIKQLRIEF
jgi:hypothetical protein